MAKLLRERHHKDKQARKNVYRTKIRPCKVGYVAQLSKELCKAHRGMIMSYWELHFGEQHNDKKDYGFNVMIASTKGLNYLKSKASVRKEVDLEECYNAIEADLPIVEKRCRCKATNSRAMGLAVPWYHRGETSVESSIPCSHGGRALVMKGAEEVDNTEVNSKYHDKMRDFGLMQECSTKERSRQYMVLYLFYSEKKVAKMMEKMVQSQRRRKLSKTCSKLG
ncbi:hypothetical protein BHE74_00044191 [Ensete ventricosum]|nr:hypothetical protein BHE74_00044191 [Ensete ventricosum]